MPLQRPAKAMIHWRVLSSAMFIAKVLRDRHLGSIVA